MAHPGPAAARFHLAEAWMHATHDLVPTGRAGLAQGLLQQGVDSLWYRLRFVTG